MKLAAQATRAASLRQFSVKHQPDLNFSLIERGGMRGDWHQASGNSSRQQARPHPRKKLRGIK
jgi:hypothetical protein